MSHEMPGADPDYDRSRTQTSYPLPETTGPDLLRQRTARTIGTARWARIVVLASIVIALASVSAFAAAGDRTHTSVARYPSALVGPGSDVPDPGEPSVPNALPTALTSPAPGSTQRPTSPQTSANETLPTTVGAAPSGHELVSAESGKCLQANPSDGSPLQLWTCNGSAPQLWTIESDGTIRSGGLCMDAAWAATSNGTRVQVVRCSGNPAQQFALNAAHDLVNIKANRCVDVTDHDTADGTLIQIWDCSGTANQKWTLQ
jgi:hypothetical protein